MSRLSELKKQYPELNLTIFDIIERMDISKTYKYIPLLCKIFGEKYREIIRTDKIWVGELKDRLKIKGFDLSNESDVTLVSFYWIMDQYPSELFEVTREFIDRMENNKIQNKDISSYSSVESLRTAISLSTLKEVQKDLESQVIKEYEDDKWLIIRPLTFQSSKKYGSGTRWCTTSTQEKNHFERYWRRGVLVYFINKETGYKFAGFKDMSDMEISFWSSEDLRIDSIQLDVDVYLYPIIKEVLSSLFSNKELSSKTLIDSVEEECLNYYEAPEELASEARHVYLRQANPQD